ncbi:LOW QUALITY PROTEIN: mas-related G-protein coupled receptor MRG-like [Phyllostomus discolor]|uniref:LOW QUALITY PROTEIN: mas-related G-protein coupled receptor MRG-like n=1 Tax=Phyllostomus discolor TaxID=89673 RepID=A0A6J2L047_9CHIR|nr:LOW QUALITY PROTEIN: mas-related G-protein coupled receptor MRG-like [Phyllostomus discolor]
MKIIAPIGILICLGGLVSNGLVLGLLGLSLKLGGFTVFIFHLSLADFLYLSCQTVLFMQIILATFHGIMFDVRYMGILTYTSYTVGLCVLTAISVTRCLSVLHPIWCRLHAPRHAPTVVCSLIWVLSGSGNVYISLVCWADGFIDCESCFVSVEVSAVLCSVLLSVTVMGILTVLFKVRCGTQRRPPLKLYITVLLTVLFLLFAFPVCITLHLVRSPNQYYVASVQLLSCVNSSANPLVYYFVGRIGGRRRGENLREAFQKTLGEDSTLTRDSSSGAVNSSG